MKEKTKTRLTAKTADKHALYEKSVQDPPTDLRFMTRVFKKERGRMPLSLREDFCGTALMCSHWVKNNAQRSAVGIDLHRPTLDYGRRTHLAPLGDAAERVTLLQQNVLDPVAAKVDMLAAFNFSYSVFKTRGELLNYCKMAHAGLNKDGAFYMDIHGGTEATVEVEEETDHKEFTYVWDQHPYDAINGLAKRYIHFRFPDGSEIKRAFTYDWRVWTLPELRDVLYDAGFKQVDVYWEGADEDGDGNGIFRKAQRADNEESWIAYVVAWR